MPRMQLIANGETSIQKSEHLKRPCFVIAILGTTGAGKSTFIEALAREDQSLEISKDQLSGFTQEASTYELENVTMERNEAHWDCTVYLIDTPGFADSKIPELEIINKAKKSIYDENVVSVDCLLYLCPITDTRIPGSKKRTIKMLQSLFPTDSASRITIVTTMWDTIVSAQSKERAEAHFEQLKNEIWKDLVDEGTEVVRFHNTHSSALEILQNAAFKIKPKEPSPTSPLFSAPLNPNDPAARILYQELLDRIDNMRQTKQNWRQECIQLIMTPDQELELYVIPKLQEAKEDLSKFTEQLVAFGKPPAGFEGIPRRLVYQELLDRVNEAQEDQTALRMALAQLQLEPQLDEGRGVALNTQLKRAEKDLVQSAAKLVEFGSPPKGFGLVVFPLHILSFRNQVRQRMQQEKRNLLARLKKK